VSAYRLSRMTSLLYLTALPLRTECWSQ
jgi:hypothetical protein